MTSQLDRPIREPHIQIVPVFLGLALVIAASTSMSLFLGSGGIAGAGIGGGGGWIAGIARFAVFLGTALLSTRIGSLVTRPVMCWAAAVVLVVGTVFVLLISTGIWDAPRAVYFVGHLVSGAGYALLYLMWVELYARMDMPHVVVHFTMVHLVSAAVSFVLSLVVATWFVAAALLVMPLASAWMVHVASRRSAGLAFMQGEEQVGGWSFPLPVVVLLFTFTFANSFVRQFLTNDLRGMALVGVILASVLALVLMRRVMARGISALFSASLPLVVAGSLCVLVALPGFGAGGAMLTNAAYTLFSVYVTSLLCNISYRYGVDALWLFGIAQAALSLGSLISKLLEAYAWHLAEDPAILALMVGIMVVVFVCLYVAYQASDERAGAWGITPQGERATDHADDRADLDQTCARLARLNGLTRREEEVALLLVRGVPFAAIEEELCVSNSTLKTHARHIYAKCGISGREGLTELVASM